MRKVTASTGIITTVAGNGSSGYSGDNGPATSASFGNTEGLAVDANGNLYIADMANDVIRKMTASTGVITTVAGSGRPTDHTTWVTRPSYQRTAPFSIRGCGGRKWEHVYR